MFCYSIKNWCSWTNIQKFVIHVFLLEYIVVKIAVILFLGKLWMEEIQTDCNRRICFYGKRQCIVREVNMRWEGSQSASPTDPYMSLYLKVINI